MSKLYIYPKICPILLWYSRGQEQVMDKDGSITVMFTTPMSPSPHVVFIPFAAHGKIHSFKMYVHCHGSST